MARVAIVTGGTRGIGRAISVELQNQGRRVVATYAGDEAAAEAFTAETGIVAYRWDVGDYDACQEGVARVEAEVGPVDVLVNNAGITRDATISNMTYDMWTQVMRVNLGGCFNMAKAVFGGMALHWGRRLWAALGQLEDSVRTGEPFQASGLDGFEGIARDPGQTAMFHQSMTDQTGPVAAAMLEVYDFSRFRSLVDVGGSYGALLAALLKAHPGQTGEVFDLPGLAEASGAYLRGAGVADRAGFVGGSFFDAVPPGADAYMLKMIIHDWRDDQALSILRNCATAAGRDGAVLVMERIAPERVGSSPADHVTIRGDILMLTAAGGQERTEAEYRALFAKAGLQVQRIVPTASGFAIIETKAV